MFREGAGLRLVKLCLWLALIGPTTTVRLAFRAARRAIPPSGGLPVDESAESAPIVPPIA